MNSCEGPRCIVCDQVATLDRYKSGNSSISRHKIFEIFCKYFYWPSSPPPQLENDEAIIPFSFCEKCTLLISTLCCAQEQLELVQREITKIVANVSSIIIESANESSEDITENNPCFKLHAVDDSIVEIIEAGEKDHKSTLLRVNNNNTKAEDEDVVHQEEPTETISRVRKIICQRYSPRVMLKDFMENAISVEIQVSNDPRECSAEQQQQMEISLQSLEAAATPPTISFADCKGPTLIYIGDQNTVTISELEQVQHSLASADYEVYEIETNYDEGDTISNDNLLSTEQVFNNQEVQQSVKEVGVSKEEDNVPSPPPVQEEKDMNEDEVMVAEANSENSKIEKHISHPKAQTTHNTRKRKQQQSPTSYPATKQRKQASVTKTDDGDKFVYDGKWYFTETENGFQCCHCDLVKSTRKVIVAHLRHHRIKELNKFSCKICSKPFVSQRDLAGHEKSCPTLQVKTTVVQVEENKFCYGDKWYFVRTGTESGAVKFKCCSCGITKTTQRNMTMHMRCHRVSESKQFTCSICGLARVTQRDLEKHERACANPKRVMEVEPGKFLFEGKWLYETTEYGFKCNTCGAVRVNKASMMLHLRRHRGKESKMFVCQPCGRSFAFKQELLTHQLHHSEAKRRTTSVKYADRKFLYGGQWRYEQLPDGDFKCDTCGVTTTTRKKMSLHLLRSHADPNRYVCDICGASFGSSSVFKCHQSTHTSARPYQCDTCGKTYKTQSQLCSHKHSHEIWKCEECGKKMYSKLLLKEHALAHRGIKGYKCSRCGREFQHRKGLRFHWKKHNDATDFTCNQCDMTFLQRREVTRHIFAVHREDECSTANTITTVSVVEIMPPTTTMEEVVLMEEECSVIVKTVGQHGESATESESELKSLEEEVEEEEEDEGEEDDGQYQQQLTIAFTVNNG